MICNYQKYASVYVYYATIYLSITTISLNCNTNNKFNKTKSCSSLSWKLMDKKLQDCNFFNLVCVVIVIYSFNFLKNILWNIHLHGYTMRKVCLIVINFDFGYCWKKIILQKKMWLKKGVECIIATYANVLWVLR